MSEVMTGVEQVDDATNGKIANKNNKPAEQHAESPWSLGLAVNCVMFHKDKSFEKS